jgi:hypothetical protein
MAKKRKAPAKKRETRKPVRKKHAGSPDTAVNTLVVLMVIVLVLGGLYFYAQNKRQVALLPGLIQSITDLIAPAATTSSPIAQAAPAVEPPSISLPPVALPTPAITAPPDITGSTQTSQTIASAKARKPTPGIRAAQPASPVEAQPSTPIAVVPLQDH